MNNSRATKFLKTYSKVFSLTAAILTFCSLSFAGEVGGKRFPDGPDLHKTPGALCENSNTYRYPAQIRYCERNVDSRLKNRIIAEYDREFGFDVQKMPRGDFKIDHFIPLSIGGSNHESNLWPQHKSVYAHSDKIESLLANLISADLITQDAAIDAVKTCKLNLERCADIEAHLEALSLVLSLAPKSF